MFVVCCLGFHQNIVLLKLGGETAVPEHHFFNVATHVYLNDRRKSDSSVTNVSVSLKIM
jgi:hypothetical protein